jgi:2-polyprenyl-3-methyl-5-hydroxy-6-metoxy-1,4-benzoquinol methylase
MTTADRTANFFDHYARDFNAIYGNKSTLVNGVVNRWLRRSMRLRYERSIAGCDPIVGASVLDVGCGPGHYSIELARRGAARVLGIDFADTMLALAQQAARSAGVDAKCKFERVDFFQQAFDESFDYVIVMGFMDYVADPVAVVRKAVGLAKRKAFFSFPLDGGLLAWQRKLRYRQRCDLYMYTPERVRQILSDAGAANYEIAAIARDLFVTVKSA